MFTNPLTRASNFARFLSLARKAATLNEESLEIDLPMQVAIPFDPQLEKLIVAEGITCNTVFTPPDKYLTLIGKI